MSFLGARIIPVLRGGDNERIYELATLLLAEGFACLEVTYTVPGAARLITRLAALPGATIGAGTVVKLEQFEEALGAGAQFVVSPGGISVLLEHAKTSAIPYLPGVLTPSEVMIASGYGYDTFKLFPGSLGGPDYLRSLKGPFPHFNFVPTGGVDSSNLRDWAEAGATAVGMGSSLTSGTPETVRARARALKHAFEDLTWR